MMRNHVAELFHVTNKDNHEVQIFGYLPPKTDGKQIKWILSVREDLRNESVETFPTFRPFEEGEVRSAALHEVIIYNY